VRLEALTLLRKEVAETIRRLYDMGYVLDYEGNVSARMKGMDRYLITPSQVPRGTIRPEDILVVNGEGEVLEGNRNPSTETGMHLMIYSMRSDVGSVIHFHSVYATALACLHEHIPPIIEEVVPYLGEDIPTVDYAMAGSRDLALNAANALDERNAVLLANHGALVCGRDLKDALHKARLLEKAANIYLLAKLVGEPKKLPNSSIQVGKELFRLFLM
jgi:L-fuculose-phosphate aldolase